MPHQRQKSSHACRQWSGSLARLLPKIAVAELNMPPERVACTDFPANAGMVTVAPAQIGPGTCKQAVAEGTRTDFFLLSEGLEEAVEQRLVDLTSCV